MNPRRLSSALVLNMLLLAMMVPAPFARATDPAAEISVGERREIEIDGARIISLSPDGSMLVGRVDSGGPRLCTYDIDTLATIACADLDGLDSGLRIEDVSWSPDSTKIAFAEDAFKIFRDGDIWVMDARSGDLTNLTDEGVRGRLPILNSDDSDITEFFIDVNPAWSPDSQSLAFSRSTWRDGDWRGNTIEIISVAGGDPDPLVQISEYDPGVVYWGIEWQGDGDRLFYNVSYQDFSNRANGIWIVDRDGENSRRVIGTIDPERGPPIVLQVSPSGDRLLGFYLLYATRFGVGGPHFALIDPAEGESTDLILDDPSTLPEAYIGLATMSPDGSRLLTVTNLTDPDYQVRVQDLPAGEPHLLVDDLTRGTTVAYGILPTWASNGSVYISSNLNSGTLLTLSGGASDTGVATPAVSGTATMTAVEIAPGATVYVNDDGVRLRSTPSRDALVVREVKRGDALTVLGPSTEGDGLTWWPVMEPESQSIGWVRAELISLGDGTTG